jgi:lipopolysaccharide transport system permease protein
MFVFGGLAGISTDGVPQPLFYMAGVCMWGYFQQCFTACSNVFAANQGVFGKVYFPRLIVPLSSITSNLIRFAIQLLMFILIYVYFVLFKDFEVAISWHILLFPVFVAMVGLHAMSWGLIITSLTTKYRDLNMLIGFGVQLLMYATPVIYPLSFAPKEYQALLNINPLTPIFEAFKYSCLGVGTFSIGGLLYSATFLAITLFLSVIIFNRTEQRFMDTV